MMVCKSQLAILLFSLIILLSCSSDDSITEQPTEVPEVSVLAANIIEGKGAGFLTFEVRLASPTTIDVQIAFQVTGITAEPGVDFEANQGTLIIPVGNTRANIEVTTFDDEINELEEKVLLKLTSAQNAILKVDSAIGIIRDDEISIPSEIDGYITNGSHYGYDLSWSDEFDSKLDLSTFTHEIGDGCPDVCGWGNNELEYYTDSEVNSFIRNGKMVIHANEIAGNTFRSARIITKDKKEFVFGRIDIRAKLPEGQGIWPAIWMLGANIDEIGWPACGEIDIMEMVGHQPKSVHGTAHWGPSNRGFSTFHGNQTLNEEKFSEGFHVWTLLWEWNSLNWYLDEELFHTITADNVTDAVYPFNSPFFFLFNIAVGGNWPGDPDETTVFPQEMEIDYIRVFQED